MTALFRPDGTLFFFGSFDPALKRWAIVNNGGGTASCFPD
jgi:hypothetical protein